MVDTKEVTLDDIDRALLKVIANIEIIDSFLGSLANELSLSLDELFDALTLNGIKNALDLVAHGKSLVNLKERE